MRDITNGKAVSPDSDFKPVSVPHLIEWIAETHAQRPEVLAAAARFLAVLGSAALDCSAPTTPTNPNTNTHTVAAAGNISSSAPPAVKRLLSLATTAQTLRLLVDCVGYPHSAALASIASVALWVVLHSSEAAKARCKEICGPAALAEVMRMAARRQSCGAGYSREGARAREALLGLLQHNSV